MEKQDNVSPASSSPSLPDVSFYIYLRPLAIMSKFLGTFPLKGATKRNGKELYFKYLSFDVLWDIVMFGTVAYLFNSYNYSLKLHSTTTVFPDFWMEFIVIKSTVRSGIQFTLWHSASKVLTRLLNEFEQYFEQQILADHKCLRLYCATITLVSVFICIVLAVAAFYNFEPSGNHNTATIIVSSSYAVLNMSFSLPMAMFIFLCMTLVASFRKININLKKLFNSNCKENEECITIEDARLHHAALTSLVKEVEKCYGYQLLSNVAFLVVDTVIHMYVFLIITGCTGWALFLLVAYDVGLALFVFITTQYLMDTANAVLEDLKAVPLARLTSNSQFQVQLFMTQIMADPIQISAAGYFVVGKTQITSILSSVATYLIVMLQFSPYITDVTKSKVSE